MSVLQLLAGIGGDLVSLATPIAATSGVVDPTDATAQYELTSGGDVRATTLNNTVNDIGDWINPKANAANYECFATLDSGTLTSGTTGSWLALSSTRTWTRNRTTAGLTQAQITVQIRRVGTTLVLATSVVTLTAQVDP